MEQKLGLSSELLKKYDQDHGSCEDNRLTTSCLTFGIANPTATVRAAKTKKIQAIMDQHNKNLKEMFDFMEITRNETFRKFGVHDDFVLNLFSAIETSDDAMFLELVAKTRVE